MNRRDVYGLILIFIIWKLIVLVFANLSQIMFPLQTSFLGGGLLNYLRNPLLWGFINFDGEHYLSIARDGYLPLTYFYFPLYPLIVRVISNIFNGTFNTFAFTGLTISNFFLVIALMGLFKLGTLLFSKKITLYCIFILLLFPTAFFLGAFYNEALFLALAVWSFYFALTKKWLLSFLLCGLATGTRLAGIALIPALFYEYFLINKRKILSIKSLFYLILSVFGIISYTVYLKITTGDLLAFFHNVEIFGGQRSTNLVTLPQVFYRYFIKILPNINYDYFPAVAVTYLELFMAILFLLLLIRSFFRQRFSFFIYSLLIYLIPTLSGSFSSFPRYIITAFPLFFVLAEYISKNKKSILYIYLLINLLLLSIFTQLFIRGYWVS